MSVAGGTIAEVDGPLSDTDYFIGMFGSGEYLYYSAVDDSAGTIAAKVMHDSNTVPFGPIANANWIGLQFTGVELGTVFMPSVFILAEEVTTPTVGLTLTAYDGASATAGNVMGTLAGAFNGTVTFGYSAGTKLLGVAMIGAPTNFQTDVFTLDSDVANSLYRVTNTDTINEEPAY